MRDHMHDAIRTRAELARRLASELKEPNAIKAVLEITKNFEIEAAKIEATATVVPLKRD